MPRSQALSSCAAPRGLPAERPLLPVQGSGAALTGEFGGVRGQLGAVLSPRHGAGDTGPAFHQGHGREVLALALRTAFLHPLPHGTVLGKELALACWAGAKAGNYNLLAQIPPAVSEVRSSWLAPSALVPPLCSRGCIWVLNEATRHRRGLSVLCASRACRRWRLLAPHLVLWCRVGSAESRRSWEGWSGLQEGFVAIWASGSPRGGPTGSG